MKKIFLKLKYLIKRMCLVDKCLLIIMTILLAQISFNLFTLSNEPDTEVVKAIDISTRTTVASIFGYFISSNFVKNEKECSREFENNNTDFNNLNLDKSSNENIQSENFIECNKENLQFLNDEKFNDRSITKNTYSNKLQIIIVTSIGTISLILLLCVRNSNEIYTASVPVISQLRDIVCGCIGFLLGSPSNKK